MNTLRAKIALLLVVAIVSVVGILTWVMIALLGPPPPQRTTEPLADQVEMFLRVAKHDTSALTLAPEPSGVPGNLRQTCPVFGLDTSPTTGQTGGMSVKVGISLPEGTHARAVECARSMGTTLSGLIDAALRAELTRREVADHVAMLAEADDANRLRARAGARSRALSAWKSGP